MYNLDYLFYILVKFKLLKTHPSITAFLSLAPLLY